jgi:hypothetical protein
MAFGDFLNPSQLMGGGGVSGLINIFLILFGALIIIGGIIWWVYNKKAWNLKVKFELPRAIQYRGDLEDFNNIKGAFDYDEGKGRYDSKLGVVWLKRKGRPRVKTRPFSINKYLRSGNILTVVQTGTDEYTPVIPQSYAVYADDEQDEICALLKLNADVSESKAWKSSAERNYKSTFSVGNLIKENIHIILIGLVIFLWGIQTYILYSRMSQ